MPIDTEVTGDADNVLAVADWLKTVKDALEDGYVEVDLAVSRANEGFQGEAGAAYQIWAETLREVTTQAYDATVTAEQKVRTYNTRLRTTQTWMEDRREYMTSIGVEVSGFLVIEPDPPEAVAAFNPLDLTRPFSTYSAEMGQHAAQAFKVRQYNRLLEQVEREFEEHVEWIETELAAALTGMEDADGLETIFVLVQSAASETLSLSVDASAERWERRAQQWDADAEERRSRVRSDTPEGRAGKDFDRMSAEEWEGNARGNRKWAAAARFIGRSVLPAYGIVDTGLELEKREDDSTVIVEGVPWVGPALGSAYETWVPEHVRTRADRFIDNTTDPFFDLLPDPIFGR